MYTQRHYVNSVNLKKKLEHMGGKSSRAVREEQGRRE